MVVAKSFLFVILLFAQSTARFRRNKRDGDICTHPSDPENGHFDCLKDAHGQYLVCTATCAPGYNFTTRDTSIVKRCNIYANFWEDDVLDLPSCLQTSEIDTCVPPQAPQHGAFRCTTNGTEKACTLECQDGFRLVPRVAVVYRCSQSGTWSPAVSNASGCLKVKVAEKDSTLSRIPRSAQLGSNVHPSITNAATCMAWGQDHYRTFDGRVYNFRGACEYLLARDCDFETFHVHVINDASCNTDIAAGTGSTTCKREVDIYLDTTTHIEMRKANTSGDLLLRWNGEVLTVPTSRDGVVFEQVGSYLTVRSSLGFTIKWDGRQSVFVKVSDELKGRTCGLCGNFDGNSDNDFENSDGQVVTSVASFANSWKRTALGADMCPDASQRTTCQTGSAQEQDLTHRSEARCALLLSDPAFVPCHAILDPAEYLEACKWDCCAHDSAECSCSTMEAYSRACMDLGVKLNWRRPDRCPITCNGGMEFQECGSVCTRQCGGTSAVCTDRTCIDGCFCPAGTLLNDGKCVAEDQCPCAHGDQDFHNGETVLQDCNTCTCTMGKWVCTNEKCPSTCSIVGDLHYMTFDGTWYNFMGMCSYYLFHGDDINIIIDNIQCGRRESSCMKSVTIEVGDDVIRMDQNHLLVLNEQEVKDLPLVSNGVKAYMVSSLFMEAELPNGMSILWDGRRRVYVTAPPSMVGKTSGLCGTFDGSQQNDFLTLDGDTEINVNAFGNRWKVDSTCRDVPLLPAPYPCDSNAQRTMQAQELCLKLKSDLFASCHSLVDVDAYYDNCVYDICACEANLQDCLCPSFGQYADTCASKGVMVEWRLQVTECMLKCAGGQEYQVCGNPCERTCRNIAEARSSTCSQRCVEGCNCPDGEALDANGECVPVSQCPCVFDGREFPPGYTTLMGSKLCVCSSAQWRCSVLQQGVPIPRNAQSLCPPTTRYTDCVSSCPTTCDSMENPTTCAPDSTHCQAGCACESGFVLDGSRCINVSMCPCHHGGQSFYEGDVISVDCNKCTCRSRRWQCESNDCAGVCTAIGDSHYTTFDGRDFQFQGMCDYVLARSRDGSATPFLVSTENIACGTSGVTCSKMVEVSVGEPGTSSFYSLRLIRGQPVTASDPGSPFTVETVGQFLRVSTTFGLSLQWDHGTRLYLTLASQHRGQVEGLCGNFNGDQKDDFTTPQGGPPAIKATTFGDSWRMHSYCGPSAEVTDTCAVAPHRKPWAQRKCGVLASDLFSSCHTIEPYEKYFDRCVYDSCACDLGGDCECLCTAIAAYAHVCATKGALIKWRSSELCPIECEDCQTYNPCVTTCPKKTCLNRLQYSSLLATCQGTSSMCAEGCDLQPCPPGQVYDSLQSPVTCIPEPLCDSTACEINGKLYREGERVYDYPMCNDQCEICNCRNGSIEHISFGYCTRVTVTSVSYTTTGETSTTASSATTPVTPITSSIYISSSTSSMSSTLTPTATSSAGTPTTPQETSPLSSSQTSISSGISSTATVTSLSSSSPPSGTSTPTATPSLTPSITPKVPLFPTTSSLLVSSESPDTPSVTSSATTVVSQSSTVTSVSSTATSSTSFTSPLSSSVSSSQRSSTSDVTSSDSHSSSTGSSSISVSPPATSHSSSSSSSPTPSSAVPPTTSRVWTPESSSVTAATSSTVSTRCTDGWTSWMSVSVPTHVNVGDVETVPLLRTRYAFCQDLQIESIQCRAVGDSTNAASGQKFTCSLPDGLVCHHVDQKEGLCLDYEVRFSCNCELVTTTPTAETSTKKVGSSSYHPPSDSNPTTSEVTQSTLTSSSLSTGSTTLVTQVSGRNVIVNDSVTTPRYQELYSTSTQSTLAPPSLSTDSPTRVTQSTLSPTTITMKVPIKSTQSPTYATTTSKMERLGCGNDSWSSWFNVDSPDGEGDFETLLEIQKLHAICDSHAYIQCRTADTHVRYDMTKDSGVVCSTKTGLACRNSQQANGSQCEDYEVQVYCDCKITICSEPLVHMAAGNNMLKMSASSEKDDTHTAEHGRLESLTNWSPAHDDPHPWLQVDFGYPLKVTGVSTMGNPVAPEWTVLYTLEVSHDCKTFQPLLDPTGKPEIFEGNTDSNTNVTHMFRQNEESVQCVKILPVRANVFYALRLEVLGCSEKIETLSTTVSTQTPTPATISKHTISTTGEIQTSSPPATPTASPTPTPKTPSRPTVSQETLSTTVSTQTPTPGTTSKYTISTTGEVQTSSPWATPTASPTPTPETPSRPTVSQGLSTTEPSSVTTPIPYTCSDGWTSWFSVDTPTIAQEYETQGDGDYELLSELRQHYSFCAMPDAIRCRGVKSKTPSHLFASHVACDLDKGLVCINAHEASGQCEDFEVSFNCDCPTETNTTIKTTVTSTVSPPPTITSSPTPGTPWSPVPSCTWTSWMNSYPRTLSSTGDFETFSNLRMSYPFCEHPTDIECRVTIDASQVNLRGKSYKDAGQLGVTCDLNRGLTCLDISQASGDKCLDYEVRVLCSDGCHESTTPLDTSSSSEPSTMGPSTSRESLTTGPELTSPSDTTTKKVTTSNGTSTVQTPRSTGPQLTESSPATDLTPGTGSITSSRLSSTQSGTTSVKVTSTVETPVVTTTAFISSQTSIIPLIVCSKYMGVHDPYVIPKDQMTASSVYDYTTEAFYGRLDSTGAWVPRTQDKDQWIQVDFKHVEPVTGVVTQGHPTFPYWVTSYTISISIDGKTFTPYVESGQMSPTVFAGNSDPLAHVQAFFDREVLARYVRIHPLEWKTAIAIRFEVLGCHGLVSPTTISSTMISESTPPSETAHSSTAVTSSSVGSSGFTSQFTSGKTPSATPTVSPSVTSESTSGSSSTTTISPSLPVDITSTHSGQSTSLSSKQPTSSSSGHTTSPTSGQTTSPTSGQTTSPTSGQTTSPTSGQTTSPTSGQTTYPTSGQTTYPTSGQTTSPTSGQTTSPASGQTTYPTSGQTTYPTSGQTTSPTSRQTTSPTSGQTTSPTSGQTTYPTSGQTTYSFTPVKKLKCNIPMGVENYQVVLDNQMTSSSDMTRENRAAAGRLFSQSSWVPRVTDGNQWLQIDLLRPVPIVAILTQGSPDTDRYVTEYILRYSLDGLTFTTYNLPSGTPAYIKGNTDSIKVERVSIWPPITAQYVRIVPTKWSPAGIALRVTFIGCMLVNETTTASTDTSTKTSSPSVTPTATPTITPTPGTWVTDGGSSSSVSPTTLTTAFTTSSFIGNTTVKRGVPVCNISMGLTDPLIISDAQLQASTCLNSDYCADRARLGLLQENHLGGGWQPSMSNDKQWIEVDFLAPYPVTGITTQGSDKTPYWVTRYIVYTSMDGINFYPITDEKTPLVSDGNTDSHSPVTHMFSKVTARYVRIRPLEFHERIGLRFDILGCQLPSTATPVFTSSSSEMTETTVVTNSSITVTLTPSVTPSMPSTAVPPSGSLSTVSQKWTSSPSSFFSILTGSSTDKLTSSSPSGSSLFPDTMPQVSISVSSHLPSVPTTTSTVTSTASTLSTTRVCMYWSPWFSSHTPSEGGEVETFRDMKTMMLVCQEQQVTQIECRATDSKLPYDQVGQVGVTCSREDLSLVCTSSAQQKCLDYEIRVLCDECISEGTTTSLGTTQSSISSGTTTETSSITVPIRIGLCKQSEWSSWINRDHPSVGDGDREFMTMDDLVAFCPGGTISQADCETVSGVKYYLSNENVECNVAGGFTCKTSANFLGCSDYRIRYYCECPIYTNTTSSVVPTSTTSTPSVTSPLTLSATPTVSPTASTVTSSPASSASPTATPTETPTASTVTSSPTSSASPTLTPSATPTLTPTASTVTSSPTSSASPTATPSATPTLTPTASKVTFSSASSATSTATPTLTPTASTVTQCSKSKWTSWINRDIPETGEGDYENLSKDELSSLCIGGTITKIECYSGDTPAISTGEVVKCSLQDGLICNNVDNGPSRCSDYRVRYFCECDISTATTIEITTTTATTTFIQCAWSSWMNADKPNQEPADLGDLETIDLLKSTYGLCPRITAVECRVAGTSTPASGDVTCDAFNGLRCYNMEQVSGTCYDYEIRVLCWSPECTGLPPLTNLTTLTTETTTVACESGYQWSACAYSCDETCDYLARLSGACDGPASTGCVPGCRPVSLQPSAAACPAGQRLKDARTCVSAELCPCMKPDGTPARAFESWTHPNDACSQCSCFSGAVRCINDDSCTILATTTSTDQTSPTTTTVCGWSQWMNMDTPATGAADIESIARAATLYNTCPTPSAIECREVTTKVTAQATGQALVCSTATGLECHNVDNVGGCKDYEIRVYCLCNSTEPTTIEKTTPTVPTTSTTPFVFCGWTQWMSSNTPDSLGEQETIPELRRHFDFCQIEDITAIECRSKISHHPSSEQAGVICDTRFSGLICRQALLAPNETCADYEVRFLCEPTDWDCRPTSTTDLTTKFSTSHVTSDLTSSSETTTERHGSTSTLSTVTPTSQDLSTTKKSTDVSSTRLSTTTSGGEVSTTTQAIVTSRGGETTPTGTSLVSSISTTALHSSPETGSTPTTTVELLSSTKRENYTKSTDGIQSVPISSVTQSVPTSSVTQSVPISSVTQSVPTSSVTQQPTPYKLKCHEEMGVASGQIRDDMITASSRRDITHDESKARLGGSGAWLPARDDKYQYIQVDFLEERYISGVTTQGRPDAPSYVTSFRVLYSVDGVNWNVYQESLTQEKIFVGNTDSNTPVTQNFRQPIRARYIRINPLSWSGRIALRFELYGCFEPYPTPTTNVPPVTTSLLNVTEVTRITVTMPTEECILWDEWVDTTHPTSPDFSDVETLEKVKSMSRVCHKPVAIQCRTAGPDHTPSEESGQQVRCFLWEGLTCLGNEQQEGICLNYEVRLGCISNTSKCTPKTTPTAAPPFPTPKTGVVPCYQGLDVSACPAACPLGTYCDGLRCVARHKCPCDLKGQFVKAGDVAQSKSCETCQCLNGRLLCGTRTCPPCPEGVAMLNSSSCECQCVRCTDKEFQCSNGHCIPASLWCDGVIDCVDDELNCLPTPSTPFITPTSESRSTATPTLGVTTSSAHTITTFDSTSSHASSGTPVTKDYTDKSTTVTSTGFTTVVVTAGNVTTPIICDHVTCPPLIEPTLGPGYTTMRVRIATSCCDEYITMCQPSLCPAADVTCTSPLVLSQIPGEQCCPKYTCVNMSTSTATSVATSMATPTVTPTPTPPVCLYLHLDHYHAEISKPVVYSPGATWNDGDCKNCTCIYKPDSTVEVVCDNQNCSPCEIGETMVTKDGECCGHCKAVGCVVNGVVYSKGDVIASDRKCYEKTCTLDGSGDAFVVFEAQKECRPLSELPLCKDEEQTSAYSSDGCCLTCIPKSSVTCSPQAMFTRLQDSVGFLKAVNPSGVECSNQVPLADLTKCAGSCDSRAIYSDIMHTFKDTCSCCTPTKTFTRSVQLTCNDGSTLDHTYTVARACSCGACSMQ